MKTRTVTTVTEQDLKTGQLEIVENGGETISAVELLALIKTNQIPLISLGACDERRWCRHVLANDAAGAASCGELRNGAGIMPWCALNGAERRSPCAFDEAADSPLWQKVQLYLDGLPEEVRREYR